jgi:phenylalanyl-tRNA synthetase beta chain
MRVPIGWLREYVDLPDDSDAIAQDLAMLGFPVEDIERRPRITGVVVARILELEKHPNADRLSVARVDAGSDTPLTIVTAATNVAAGQTIALATIGARLPQLAIEPRKMRGIASEGMMISADELALPPDWFEDGILQLGGCDAAPGTDAVALFGLDGDVLDVEVTSNRVDVMSMTGLARELAASYGKPLRLPSLVNPGTAIEPAGEAPSVTIESPDCARFVAQRFAGLAIAPAPAWMRIRLALAGQRPIDNVVDVSNYVMLEVGQPLHFYDAGVVRDAHFFVRDARAGERLVTLDGVERTLTPQMLVIADSHTALGLAGVMGGRDSEVGANTRAILLEAANFNGARVRRTSQALALRSEASSRHEKTLALALCDAGAARAAQLLCDLGAIAYQPHAFGVEIAAAEPISLQESDVERLLGLAIPVERVAAHLRALGCTVSEVSGRELTVVPPPWRRDVSNAADLVEEVARMEGYDRIEAVVPAVPSHGISSADFNRETNVAHALSSLGYREVITHSLHGREVADAEARSGIAFDRTPVEVLNPLSEEQRYLRVSLADGLLPYFARVNAPVRAFEIGHAFTRANGRIDERPWLAFGFAAEPIDEQAWHDTHFLRLKGDCEALLTRVTGQKPEISRAGTPGLHPGKSATLSIGGIPVLSFGRLDPRLGKAFDVRLPVYVAFGSLLALPEATTPRYHPPSKFPGTSRDIALSVALDVTAGDVEKTIAQALGAECTSVRVFDEYRGPQAGEGRKSLAVRIALQRFDGTMTDDQADAAIARALDALQREMGAAIRT